MVEYGCVLGNPKLPAALSAARQPASQQPGPAASRSHKILLANPPYDDMGEPVFLLLVSVKPRTDGGPSFTNQLSDNYPTALIPFDFGSYDC